MWCNNFRPIAVFSTYLVLNLQSAIHAEYGARFCFTPMSFKRCPHDFLLQDFSPVCVSVSPCVMQFLYLVTSVATQVWFHRMMCARTVKCLSVCLSVCSFVSAKLWCIYS